MFKDLFTLSEEMTEFVPVFVICVAVLAGLLLSRLAKLLKLPAVTAYLVAGILIGPLVLGRLGIPGVGFESFDAVEAFGVFSEVALGFIAFTIGNEFRVSQLKAIGKQATVIAIVQALMATLLVDASLIGLHFLMPDKLSLPVAIVLGAVATATAPAATLMVIRQYKAKGKLTDILLPVVALDDAIGLVVFAVSFGIAKAMGDGHVDLISIIVNPLLEIICSLALGVVMGILFTLVERIFSSNSKRMAVAITFVLATVALSKFDFEFGKVQIGFSSLLVCMMLGTVFCNLCDFSEDMMGRTDKWSAPLLVLFFVISGAELDLTVFCDIKIIAIGVVYIIFRCLGKYFGSYISAKWTKCDDNICKYLGITLFPQAGVAIGMASMAAQELSAGGIGMTISNICLFAVLIYELFGPMLTKISLIKAGEIDLKPVKLKHDHIVPDHQRPEDRHERRKQMHKQ